jgi:hypothetical protein
LGNIIDNFIFRIVFKAVEYIRKAARLGDRAAQSFLKAQKIEW